MTNMEAYKAFLAEVRKETGIDAFEPDEDGLVSVNVDEKYNINLQLIEDTARVLCFIEVCTLKKDTPKNVYRDLLVGALFGKDTAGGYFTIEPQSETLIYNYLFELNEITKDIEDFTDTLEKMLQLCDMWIDRINTTADNDEKHEELDRLTSIGMMS
ncbi:type III secretion system chaperone [uncultured Succinivibrio sp.]|uniref:type III secretion system chaperone n=1 Tax=uncultured Succinivibrio sp. TaxID=540749 RepID=UPI0025EF8B68|nr:type III secretion system chaperone [uncultured Succinivibrio sp.]